MRAAEPHFRERKLAALALDQGLSIPKAAKQVGVDRYLPQL
jgi:hypothetical protein